MAVRSVLFDSGLEEKSRTFLGNKLNQSSITGGDTSRKCLLTTKIDDSNSRN